MPRHLQQTSNQHSWAIQPRLDPDFLHASDRPGRVFPQTTFPGPGRPTPGTSHGLNRVAATPCGNVHSTPWRFDTVRIIHRVEGAFTAACSRSRYKTQRSVSSFYAHAYRGEVPFHDRSNASQNFFWRKNKCLEYRKIYRVCLKGMPSRIVNEAALTSLTDRYE